MFQTGQWDREAVKDSSLTKVTGKITLTGDYGSIRQFLFELETAQEFVVVEKVELSEANLVKATSALEVQLAVATYYLTDEAGRMVPAASPATARRRRRHRGPATNELLPPPGPQRRRQVTLLIVAIAALAVLLYRYVGTDQGAQAMAPGAKAVAAPVPGHTRSAAGARLARETRTGPGRAGDARNLFRFGERPPPPPPPPPAPVAAPPAPPPPPPGRRRFRRSRCC